MKPEHLRLPCPPPKEYWDDREWAYDHLSELSQQYPDLWVAVVDKKVTAAGKVIAEVRATARQKTGRQSFPVVLAERGIYVYPSTSACIAGYVWLNLR